MAFPQLRLDFGPMSPERIEHFETIRKTRVPRFLFRAFTAASGGGQHLAINNESQIVPHGLMDGSKLDFYSRSEAEILQLVLTHMSSREYPLTLCTSWEATFFGVLCYAKYLAQDHDVWIAVIDTHLLEDVLVFNDQDLVGVSGLEFQAYGRISGAGYKAVKLSAMIGAGLYQLFPELESWVPPSSARLSSESFGQDFHHDVFASPVVRVTMDDVQVAKRISSLFGTLNLPVVLAVLSLRPRDWLLSPRYTGSIDLYKALAEFVGEEVVGTQIDTWRKYEFVFFSGFVDVEQWVALLLLLIHHVGLRNNRKRRASKADGVETDGMDGNSMEGDGLDDGKDWGKILRPRTKRLRLE